LIVDGAPRPLRPLVRDEVYRIGREALINAFRHASAKNIELELRYSYRQLHMLIRDDGRGIDPQVLAAGREGHWGLSGMRERADRIGARFHVSSAPAAGTEVDLAIPSHVAFEDHRNYAISWPGRRFPKVRDSRPEAGIGAGK
jgi:signal transduction histidine kinase